MPALSLGLLSCVIASYGLLLLELYARNDWPVASLPLLALAAAGQPVGSLAAPTFPERLGELKYAALPLALVGSALALLLGGSLCLALPLPTGQQPVAAAGWGWLLLFNLLAALPLVATGLATGLALAARGPRLAGAYAAMAVGIGTAPLLWRFLLDTEPMADALRFLAMLVVVAALAAQIETARLRAWYLPLAGLFLVLNWPAPWLGPDHLATIGIGAQLPGWLAERTLVFPWGGPLAVVIGGVGVAGVAVLLRTDAAVAGAGQAWHIDLARLALGAGLLLAGIVIFQWLVTELPQRTPVYLTLSAGGWLAMAIGAYLSDAGRRRLGSRRLNWLGCLVLLAGLGLATWVAPPTGLGPGWGPTLLAALLITPFGMAGGALLPAYLSDQPPARHPLLRAWGGLGLLLGGLLALGLTPGMSSIAAATALLLAMAPAGKVNQ